MKRKLWIMPVVMLISLLVVGAALAFGMGNADGVWQYVEDNSSGGAFCVTYGTGNGTSETARSRNAPSIQTPPNTDENQVHYGKGTGQSGDCPSSAPSSGWFDAQSGLGFDGNNNIGGSLLEGTPFLVGRLTHYNRPIYLTNSGSTPPQANFMEWVDLDVTVGGITCSNGQPPNEGSTLTFTYRVNFDETSNSANPCPYGGNGNGCYDAVTVGSAPPAAKFTCDDANEPVQGEYTIQLLGFQPHNSDNCNGQTYNSSLVKNQYITAESSTNHACLWAKIADFVPTAVDLISFTAGEQDGGVALAWVTASEVDNVGYNLYRATNVDQERVKLNSEVIPAVPGSAAGASYDLVDPDALPGVTYHYWLEDVDIYGKTSLHGPVTVNGEPAAMILQGWQVYLPAVTRKP